MEVTTYRRAQGSDQHLRKHILRGWIQCVQYDAVWYRTPASLPRTELLNLKQVQDGVSI